MASPGRLALAAALASAGSGCLPEPCCNSCGRVYAIGDALAYPGVAIGGIDESGKECEMGAVPRALPDGQRAILATVTSASPSPSGTAYVVEVVDHALEPEVCGPLAPMDAAALVASSIAVGTDICLFDHVSASEVCTQLACGGI